jgi:hypothetical protein
VIAFDSTSLVVLDEADKMLSVGFEPQLQRLKAVLLDSKAAAGQTGVSTGAVSKKKSKKQKQQQEAAAASTAGAQQCQVLLFSATLPKAVRVTADVWLKPGYKSVSCSAGADAISNTITQASGLPATRCLSIYMVQCDCAAEGTEHRCADTSAPCCAGCSCRLLVVPGLCSSHCQQTVTA